MKKLKKTKTEVNKEQAPKYLTEAHKIQSEKAKEYITHSKTLGYTLEDVVEQQKRNSQ